MPAEASPPPRVQRDCGLTSFHLTVHVAGVEKRREESRVRVRLGGGGCGGGWVQAHWRRAGLVLRHAGGISEEAWSSQERWAGGRASPGTLASSEAEMSHGPLWLGPPRWLSQAAPGLYLPGMPSAQGCRAGEPRPRRSGLCRQL